MSRQEVTQWGKHKSEPGFNRDIKVSGCDDRITDG